MKQNIFELWIELLSDTDQPEPTRDEMIRKGIDLCFPNIDTDSIRFKLNYEILEMWHDEFKNPCLKCGDSKAYLVGKGFCNKCVF